MNWLTTLRYAVFLLLVQYNAAQDVSPTLSRSPWADPEKASSLLDCMISRIASSDVLPQQDKDDLGDIVDTMMSAINGANAKGKSSGAQLQAINMAVASSLAELVVAEGASDQDTLAVKRQALSGALEQCFQEVTGRVDTKFISEINDLISMFARQTAYETKEAQAQEVSYAAGSSVSSTIQTTGQSAINNYQANQMLEGSSDGQGVLELTVETVDNVLEGDAQAGVIGRLADALADTYSFRTVLRSGASPNTVNNVIQRTVLALANTLGVDGNNLVRVALQAVSNVPAGSDTNAYAQALASALVNGGIVNERNIDILGSRVVSAVENGLSSAAQALGINLDTGNVQNDIRFSNGFLTTGSSTSSFSQTSASTTGGAASTGEGFAGGQGLVPMAGATVDNVLGGGAQAGLIGRLANALAGTYSFRTVLRSGASPNTVNNVIQRTVLALANTLGVDGNNLVRVALQAVSNVPAGSDTNAYAQALARALVTGGIVNERNIDTLGSRVVSAVGNGLASAAQGLGINLDTGNVQNNIRSSTGFLTTGSSTRSFSQTSGSINGNTDSTTGGSARGQGLLPMAGVTVDNVLGGGSQAGLIGRLANALAATNSFKTVLRSGASQTALNNVIQRTVLALANTLRVDGNNLVRIALQAVSNVPAGSGTNAYAQALASALITGGIVNERNIDTLGSRVVSAVGNGLASAAQGLGINLDIGNVQNDIGSSTGFLSTGSSTSKLSKTSGSTTGGAASKIGGFAGGRGLVTMGAATVDNVLGGGAQAGLIGRLANALAGTYSFRTVLRSGASPNTVNYVIQRTVQSLANSLGVDGNKLIRVALQAVSNVPVGSSTNAYAQALASALVTGGIVNERNIDTLGSRVVSAVVNGLASAAQALGINLDTGNVQNDIRFSNSFLTTGSSTSSLSQTSASTTGGAASTGKGFAGGQGLVPMAASTVDNVLGGGAQAGVIGRLANALAGTYSFRTVLRSGASPNTVNNVIQRTVLALSNTFGVDGNNLVRVALQAVSNVPAGSDTNAYAQALASALVTGGIVNERNIDILGSRVVSAVENGLSSAAQALGINLDTGNLQNDIRSSNGFPTTGSSTSSFSQTSASTTGGAASTSEGFAGGRGLVPMAAATVDNVLGGGAQAGLIGRLANALAGTYSFQTVLRIGATPNTVNNVIQRTVVSLANTLGVEGNNLVRVALQAVSNVPAGSDTNAYAQALASALVTGGIVNERNIDTLGSRVVSAVVKGLAIASQGLGINLDSGNVQNDIRSSTGLLTTGSSTSSLSQTSGSTTGAAASTIGGYTGGQGLLPMAAATVDSVLGGDVQAGLIGRLANALAGTYSFRTVLRSSASPNTVNNIMQRTVLALASTLGVDGNNLVRRALQAVSNVPAGSDTNAYAQALASALVTGGIVNERNIDILGSRVVSAVENGLSSAAQALGISLDTGNVQNDIRSSTGFLTTGSSTSSLSQTSGSTTGAAASTVSGYTGGQGLVPMAAATVDNVIGGGAQAGLIGRLANALAATYTFRTVMRSGASPNTVNNVIQRTVLALANTLGVDGNNLVRVALQAVSNVPVGSDTNAYAQALASALVTGGIVNERNIDILGSRVVSAVENGLSSAAQALGINLDTGNVQNDIRSSNGFLTTGSSTSGFSQTSASSSGGAASTGEGFAGGQGHVAMAASTVDNVLGGGAQAGVIGRLANALAGTNSFRTVLRSGASPNTVNNVIQRTLLALANSLGVDGNNLVRRALQAVSNVPVGSDTNAYAQALASALVTGGIVNERNIDILGSRVVSAVENGLSSAAQALGINLDTGNVQNDIRSSNGFLTTGPSTSSFSQTSASSTGGAASTGEGFAGGQGLVPMAASTVDNVLGGEAQAGVIGRLANALAGTNSFRTVLRSGASPNTVNNVIQRTVLALANSLGVDGNNLVRVALQAVSNVPAGSDTNAYAQALASALVTGGIVNERNIDILGSRVVSAVEIGLSSAAQALGINLDTSNVQNDIRSSTGFLTTGSSTSSLTQTSGSTTGSAASTIGGYTGGQGLVPMAAATVDNVLGRGAQAGLVGRLANALAATYSFRTVLRSGASPNTVNNVIQRTVLALANTLGVDGNNLVRIALQAVSNVPSGSDTNAYAQALASALITGGIVNERNIDTLGSRVVSAVVNGLASAAQALGINLDTGNLQNDIRSSTGFLTTGSSTSSLSETSGSTAGGAASNAGLRRYGDYGDGSGVLGGVAQLGSSTRGTSGVSSFISRQSAGKASSSSGRTAGSSIASTLNSAIGLKSVSAAARIGQMTSSILNAIGPNGIDANGLARSLQACLSSLRGSGMAPNEAKIEVLLETVAGLLQILSNAQIRGVNTANSSSVINSVAKSFELALA